VLQSRGIETVRVGKKVELAGVPKELIEKLSPARRVMNEARMRKEAEKAKGGDEPAKTKGATIFDGPKAQDIFARQARREAGPRVDKTPAQLHRECKEIAARHGVTLESLQGQKGRPIAAHDPVTATATALRVAKEAVSKCAKKHGEFTAVQFQEKLFTLAIGKPTTVKALDVMAKDVLKDRSIAGVRMHTVSDGTERYTAPQSKKVQQAAKQAYRADTKETWEEIKAAAKGFGDASKGLGAAVLIATTKKATEIVNRLAELVNPPPQEKRIDAKDVSAFIDQHKKTHYWKAHGKALAGGLLEARGNPHERAEYAEQRYAELRSYKRLSNNTVYVVERGDLVSARERQQLAKIARRDGATLFISEIDPDRGNSQQKTRLRSL
jgi:hypothetical protein